MLGRSGHVHNLLAPFVPEPVHEAVAIMFDDSDGLTYDEVRAKAPFDMQAYEAWLGKIRESKEAYGSVPAAKVSGPPRKLVSSPDDLRQSLSGRHGASMHDIQGFPTRDEENDHETINMRRFCLPPSMLLAPSLPYVRAGETITLSFSPAH